MDNQFSQLGVNEPIIEAISKMGFETPTDVQAEAIPQILNKKDLIVMSKTGSGKTGAFGIPILQSIEPDGNGPKALVMTPTRELAVQVDSEFQKMGKNLDIKTTAVYGQHNIRTEMNELNAGAAIVTGTPGRVFDHINRKTLKTKNIEYVVLDEADRMLDMGFIDQVIAIIKTLPRNRVTLLFSATMPPEIQRICKSYMNDPLNIELETETKTVDTIRQIYYRVERDQKRTQLDRLIKFHQPESCMIFCNTRIEVDKVCNFLHAKGFYVEALHGANKQHQRMKTINKFKKKQIQIMVATDVAARGIHIDDLQMVINYDVPEDRNSYVHRIGRTGRAGASGLAFCLVTSDDIMTLYDIEEHVGCLIDEADLPSDEQVADAIATTDVKWASMEPPKPKPEKKKHEHHKKSGDKRQDGKKKSGSRDGQKRHDDRLKHGTSKKHHEKPQDRHQGDKHKVKDTPHTVKHHEPMQHETKQHKPKKTARKTKVVMTKMGPIEMFVDEKPSFLDKVKNIFKKK